MYYLNAFCPENGTNRPILMWILSISAERKSFNTSIKNTDANTPHLPLLLSAIALKAPCGMWVKPWGSTPRDWTFLFAILIAAIETLAGNIRDRKSVV